MSASDAFSFDRRSRELASVKGWYTDHLTRSTRCGCTVTAPDPTCDVGWALFRVAQAERGDEKQRKRA